MTRGDVHPRQVIVGPVPVFDPVNRTSVQIDDAQVDACVCLGGNRQKSGSLVGFVAHNSRGVDAHERTDFINDRVKDLFGGHAPGEECGDAPKCGLLGLDFREMRINSGAMRW